MSGGATTPHGVDIKVNVTMEAPRGSATVEPGPERDFEWLRTSAHDQATRRGQTARVSHEIVGTNPLTGAYERHRASYTAMTPEALVASAAAARAAARKIGYTSPLLENRLATATLDDLRHDPLLAALTQEDLRTAHKEIALASQRHSADRAESGRAAVGVRRDSKLRRLERRFTTLRQRGVVGGPDLDALVDSLGDLPPGAEGQAIFDQAITGATDAYRDETQASDRRVRDTRLIARARVRAQAAQGAVTGFQATLKTAEDAGVRRMFGNVAATMDKMASLNASIQLRQAEYFKRAERIQTLQAGTEAERKEAEELKQIQIQEERQLNKDIARNTARQRRLEVSTEEWGRGIRYTRAEALGNAMVMHAGFGRLSQGASALLTGGGDGFGAGVFGLAAGGLKTYADAKMNQFIQQRTDASRAAAFRAGAAAAAATVAVTGMQAGLSHSRKQTDARGAEMYRHGILMAGSRYNSGYTLGDGDAIDNFRDLVEAQNVDASRYHNTGVSTHADALSALEAVRQSGFTQHGWNLLPKNPNEAAYAQAWGRSLNLGYGISKASKLSGMSVDTLAALAARAPYRQAKGFRGGWDLAQGQGLANLVHDQVVSLPTAEAVGQSMVGMMDQGFSAHRSDIALLRQLRYSSVGDINARLMFSAFDQSRVSASDKYKGIGQSMLNAVTELDAYQRGGSFLGMIDKLNNDTTKNDQLRAMDRFGPSMKEFIRLSTFKMARSDAASFDGFSFNPSDDPDSRRLETSLAGAFFTNRVSEAYDRSSRKHAMSAADEEAAARLQHGIDNLTNVLNDVARWLSKAVTFFDRTLT